MSTSVIFVVKSKFGKRIRLTKTIWFHKILKRHPELGTRNEYVEQVKKTKDLRGPRLHGFWLVWGVLGLEVL